MNPGEIFAVGPWILACIWLAWEFIRAPELDEDEQPLDRTLINCEQTDHREMGILLSMDDWRVPARQRHG